MKFYLSKVLIIFILIFPLLVFAYNSQGFGNRDSEPYIDNLNPDSLATGVDVNKNIKFNLHDSDGILIDSILVIIIENDNQDFHNYSTALGNLGENVVSDSLCEITIDPQTIFRYGDTIFVNVRALDVLENEMNVTYWFKCMEDNDSPYIYPGSLSPSNEEINVSLGTNIEFGIRDQGGAGVSLSTIVVKVNQTLYDYEDSGIFSYEPAGTGFNITVNPTNNFNFGYSVNIEINANDLAIPPNSMTILSYFICASENTSPTVEDFSISTDEDVAIVIPFSLHSSDYEGQTLSYEVVDGPYHGIYSNSTYISDLNYNGIDSLDYVAFDGTDSSDVATVFISVYPVNDAPLAGAGDDFEAFEGTEVTLDGSASYDIDEDTITYLWSGELADLLDNDTLATPTFTAPEVVGDSIYTFYLMVYDGEYYSELDEVIITIFNVNQPPIANAGEDQEVDEGTFVTLDGSGSSDPDEDDLTYAWTALEGVMLNDSTLSNPVFIAPSVSGETDLFFVLIVNDGEYDSEPDTVIITVRDIENYPPNIADLSVSTLEDISVEIILTGTDPDGDTLSYEVVDSPTNGIYADSVYTYTPNEDYFGEDSFTYRAYDGTDSSDVATVFITITSVDDEIEVTELLPAEFTQIINETDTINFSITASDPDGNELIYNWKLDDVEVSAINSYNFTTDYTSAGYYSVTLDVTDNYGRDALNYHWNVTVTDIDQDIVVTELLPTEGGDVEINETETINFSITASDPDGNGLSYVWKLDDNVTSVNSIYDFVTDYEWSGSYVVTLEVSDNFNRSTLAYTWNVKVNNLNRNPIVEDTTVETNEDISVEIILTGTDPDGDTLSYEVVDLPTNGIYADSVYVYTPNEDYFGEDSFTYRAYDGWLYSETGTVFITITSVDDEIEVTELLPAEFTQIINETDTINFSITASDPDGNDLSYIWKLNEVEVSTESTFNFITDYTSSGYYSVTLDVTDNYGRDALSYQWNVTVTDIDQDIVVTELLPAEFTQTINEIETINFSITASDPDGNGLSYVWKLDDNVTSVNSIYDFVTDYEWSGSYVVTLEVSDNFNRSTLAYTWNVTVNNVNRIPVVENMAINTGEDTAVEIIFTGTDSDGDDLTFAVVDSPTNGIYADSVYTPNEDYFGEDSFTYRAYDGTDSSDVATVFITITSVDDEIEVTELLPAEFTQIINETETINFSITASDPDGNDLSYIWKLNEVEVSTESTFNFITDNTSAGYYAVTLEVMDNYSKNSLSYTWDIAVLSDEKVILDPHTVPEDASCEIIVITTQSTDKITCKIFNRRGKLIKVLDVQEDKTTTWDKKDKNGRPVPGGFYIYQVKIDEKIYQGSIIIVR